MSIVTYNITYTTCHLATFTIIIYNTILSEYLSIMPGHDVLKRAVLFLGSEQSALICLKINLYLILSYIPNDFIVAIVYNPLSVIDNLVNFNVLARRALRHMYIVFCIIYSNGGDYVSPWRLSNN